MTPLGKAGRAVEQANSLLARVPSPSILVAFSGGKDSIATLDLCVKHFRRVEAFFMYMVEGLRVEEEMLRIVLAKYPQVRLHRVPHFELSRCMRLNLFECNPRHLPVKRLDHGKLEAYLRAETGIEWFAYGERAADGLVRNAKLKKIGGIWPKFKRVYPIYLWKSAEVYGYLRSRKLPAPRIIGGRKVSGAVAVSPQELSWLKREYPDDYTKVLRAFPAAGAGVFRWESGMTPDKRGRFVDGTVRKAAAGASPAGEALEVPEVHG